MTKRAYYQRRLQNITRTTKSIAPHITEELNKTIGYEPICNRPWPKYDEAKTEDQEKEIAIQVNGKVRDTIKININTSKEELEKQHYQEKT